MSEIIRPGPERLHEAVPAFFLIDHRPTDEGAEEIVAEMHTTRVSERAGRLIDQDQSASMEKKKREGYF